MRSILVAILLLVVVPNVARSENAHNQRTSLIFVSDSIGAGAGTQKASQTILGRIARREGYWYMANLSRGAMTVAPGRPWPPFNPGMLGLGGVIARNLVLLIGVNDYNGSSPMGLFRTSYSKILLQAQFWGVNVICVTPIWRVGEDLPNREGLYLQDYRNAIVDICTTEGFSVVHGESLIPHDPGLYVDGLHPNPRGHAFIARRLLPELRRLLVPG